MPSPITWPSGLHTTVWRERSTPKVSKLLRDGCDITRTAARRKVVVKAGAQPRPGAAHEARGPLAAGTGPGRPRPWQPVPVPELDEHGPDADEHHREKYGEHA